MPPPILEIFMPRFFMPPWIFLSSKWTCKIQLGISIFLCTNFLWPQFFMSTLFMPSPKKLKSLCHAIFMPPPKTLCHVFMPSWRWHKKKGDGIKKKTNASYPAGCEVKVKVKWKWKWKWNEKNWGCVSFFWISDLSHKKNEKRVRLPWW